jgi:hypothetical protein
MTILVLCWESNLCNTLGFYAQALRRRGVRLVCVGPEFPWNGDLDEWLRLCPERPSLIWHPEADVPFFALGSRDRGHSNSVFSGGYVSLHPSTNFVVHAVQSGLGVSSWI